MTKQKDEPKILLDADVVIHFIIAGFQLKLTSIFPGRFVILDKVKQELTKRKTEALGVENFLNWCKIPVVIMPGDVEILKEYATLKKSRGDGESACMAVARYKREYIASSNLRDIREYCQQYDIVFYTTIDILEFARQKGILSENDCDTFIATVKKKGSKMPYNTMAEYKRAKNPSQVSR
ncbi:hypothetical protein ACE38W_06765 [Chitinophaga sp. Hz27]|uniref:hypothetical protein n=1 Tax=Chitinophaga sp. Hz27 TaxID=3347169 RepID=UPI0035E21340